MNQLGVEILIETIEGVITTLRLKISQNSPPLKIGMDICFKHTAMWADP